MKPISLSDIIQSTSEFGEGWAVPHARRVLQLARQIAGELQPDWLILEYAVYLHDWGAFPRYAVAGVPHPERSRQVAETDILPATGLPDAQVGLILQAIELHDYRDPRPAPAPEALLLREADCLDFLGVTGMAREFAWGPNNLSTCRRRILERREAIQSCFTLPAAQQLAARRLEHMRQALAWLEEESLGEL